MIFSGGLMTGRAQNVIVGLFVGGESTRMGSPKGLLVAPDGSGLTLVERLLGVAKQALPDVACYLVGERNEYAGISAPVLADVALGCGPLGGLVALLDRAESDGAQFAVVLACDLPFLRPELLVRLVTEALDAEIYCPHVDGRYQPLVARYQTSLRPSFEAALEERRLALQPLLKAARTVSMPLSMVEQSSVADWDTPKDAGLR